MRKKSSELNDALRITETTTYATFLVIRGEEVAKSVITITRVYTKSTTQETKTTTIAPIIKL